MSNNNARPNVRRILFCLVAVSLLSLPQTMLSIETSFRVIGSSGLIAYDSEAMISVGSNNPVAPSVPFKIDGSNYHPNGTEYLDGEWNWYTITPDVPHEIEMPDPWTNPSNGITYYFSTWDDGVEDNPRTVTLEAGSSQSLYAVYTTTPDGQPPPPPPPPNGFSRLFADNSIWNTKIPAGVAYRPDSQAMFSASKVWGGLGIRAGDIWMPAIYDRFEDTLVAWRWISGINVPVPLRPDGSDVPWPGGPPWYNPDGAGNVIDWTTGKLYGMYKFTGYDAAVAWVYDDFYNAMGYAIPKDGPAVGGGAAGTPPVSGKVRPEEIIAGVIPHMMNLHVGGAVRGPHVYPPAPYSWAYGSGLHIGSRIQLNPDYDISYLSPVAQIFAQAMKDYGAMPKETTGGSGWAIECEWDGSVQERLGISWSDLGVNTELLRSIPLSEYRVLEYGQKDANGNWVSGDLYP